MAPYSEIDLDHISFAEWLVKLDECAAKTGYGGSQSFTQVTGIQSWHSFYEAGISPENAILSAANDGFEFGEDYK